MGTELLARGAEPGECNDYLSVTSPQVVVEIHRAYLEAGSDVVLTNSFGANRFALGRHGLAEEVVRINEAAARIARQAAGEEKYVLGDVGPSGDFLEPLGSLKRQELVEAFEQQCETLLEGGADGLLIETMTALEEAEAVVEAAQRVAKGRCPILVSMAFDKAGAEFRTMMGVEVGRAVSRLAALGVDAVGFNCGTLSLEEYVDLAEVFVQAVRDSGVDIAVCAEPNAGQPELVHGRAVYGVSSEQFAAAVERIYATGVRIVGGCCGTRPAHIAAVAKALRG